MAMYEKGDVSEILKVSGSTGLMNREGMGWADSGLWRHQTRVCRIVRLVAEEMGLPLKDRLSLIFASLLHDVGKFLIPSSILNAPRKLTREEFEIIKQHPELGAKYLASYDFIPEDIPMLVRQHQEHFDGTGYPDRLAGDKIDLRARLITLADSYDAMTSRRPYCDPKERRVAMSEILSCAGSHFDPRLAPLFVNVLERGW